MQVAEQYPLDRVLHIPIMENTYLPVQINDTGKCNVLNITRQEEVGR
jgi:hypothetical protein